MKKIHHYSRKVLKHIYLVSAAIILVFALLFTAARFMAPVLKNYRIDVENFASSIVHRPVQIGSIEATWHGFQPALKFNNVAVLNKPGGEVLFFLKNFEVSINLIDSLIDRRWIIDRLYANGLKMVAIQKADKTWYVKGLQ
jgi:uncharacterized protein YhdP